MADRPHKEQTNFRLSRHAKNQLFEIGKHQGRSGTQVLETAIDHYYIEVIRQGLLQNAAESAERNATMESQNWQDVFGDGMTAKQIVDRLGEQPTAIAAWLEAQYTEMAVENPQGGYDKPIDSVAFAQQIINEARE
jgi:hypothetical protein